ncbi:fibroblast growth factor receptor-like [Antedon mediterranea]|uniref:fibroblast growth factor receptor-like n=1 Tax=Antedon mediterranea TaxID=105859 RepID=UPI003AF4B8F7
MFCAHWEGTERRLAECAWAESTTQNCQPVSLLCNSSTMHKVSNKKNVTGLSKTLIAAVTATLCSVTVVLVAFLYVIVKRRTINKDGIANVTLPPPNSVKLTTVNSVYDNSIEPSEHEFKNYEIPRNRIVVQSKVGRGEFGKVMMGHVIGLDGSDEMTVAIKSLRDNCDRKDDMLDEIRLLIELGKHQNIIKLVGCVTTSQPYLALFDFMKYGNLLEFLRMARQKICYYVITFKRSTTFVRDGAKLEDQIYDLSLVDQLNMSRQIANGMLFVSSLRYYHGDLAARNVLVGENLTMKICDFGLAADIYQTGYNRMTPEQKRPIKWSSLETLLEGVCTIKSDVWSYGVVLYEVFTLGAVPYPRIDTETLLNNLKAGKRLPKPEHCLEEVYRLMLRCWLKNPIERPNFDNIVEEFTEFLEKHSNSQYIEPVSIEYENLSSHRKK